ncbi:DGQHR domain-containing protein [Flavobacterium supellecticarium]|uniref:DGQHR domain-containing protein n=2 Tax=Flavobacterium supellecticarium TaxID=2565924 RepID=A0A4S4A4T4_9FLAO|nr:DGQHR domain-containing protein [Flavobacterium supellecticarium]
MTRKNSKKKPRKKLSAEVKAQRKEQRDQRNEITTILKNIGFQRIANVDGKEIVYKDRTSEMDDIFVCENVILITEYTLKLKPGDHIKNKTLFYNKVLESERDFIEFLIEEPKLSGFKKYYDEVIKDKFSINELKLRILYCSKHSVVDEHKINAPGVIFFDYHIVQYFKSLTKVIKKSSKHEFCDFINLPFAEFGDNIQNSDQEQTNKYLGHILPEEKSSFKNGYKIVSFYIDADSLIRRSFVLRQEGWREKQNIGYYQRMFEGKKITGMRKYLSERGRVFINNIISTISEDKIKLLDDEGQELEINEDGQFISSNSKTKVTPTQIIINDESNIIGLIDGQHRTYAYHEGDDQYENTIKRLRKIQNLLVTGIIFPKKEKKENRLKFEANLFLEINSNQTNVRSQLKQEIELMISPFSSIAIGKRILSKLNENGPLEACIELYSFEKGKIKTASIVSFGLRPLIKLDAEKSTDSIFYIWNNENKNKLKDKDSDEYELLEEYIGFSVTKIRDIFIAIKDSVDKDKWNTYSAKSPNGILSVTFVNGILNVLRLLIENNKLNTPENYKTKLSELDKFPFKSYKSSQYRKMGQDIYDKYFN